MSRKKRVDIHTFYCIKCGQEVFPLARTTSFKHEKFHRKRLYCWHCKQEINCIEIKSDDELYEFKEKFENGEFESEAADSMDYVRSTCLG